MDTYSVESDGGSGFKVRARSADNDIGRIVGLFPSEREAEDWINQLIQLTMKTANASDGA
jgi:hypothetical protein